jgi:hypothetical protein
MRSLHSSQPVKPINLIVNSNPILSAMGTNMLALVGMVPTLEYYLRFLTFACKTKHLKYTPDASGDRVHSFFQSSTKFPIKVIVDTSCTNINIKILTKNTSAYMWVTSFFRHPHFL